MANSEAIQNSCKFKIAEASEKIFELAENTWAVYSIGTINTNQVCQARNSIQTRQINSGDTVTIEPGCYIRTMDHVISADESETIEIQRKTMDWAGEIADLFGRANTESIHKAIQGLRTKYNGEFDASELFKELDQIKPAEAHWTFTSPAAMIDSHQHLVKKLPEERERYWNNISSNIRRRNLIRRQAQNIFFCK